MSYLLRSKGAPATFLGYKTIRGNAVLSSMQFNGSAEESIDAIRKWYLANTLFSAVVHWVLCRDPVLGIAIIDKNIIDFTANLPTHLTIKSFTRDLTLTKAWRSPQTLADDPDYFDQLALATTASPGTWDNHARVLFIDSELAKGRIRSVVAGTLVLAVVAGVAVGIVSGDVDAGAGVTSALVGMVAVFAGFVCWVR